MGDIWPYGGPAYVSWDAAYNEIVFFTNDTNEARIMAAIGSAESSLDYTVINDTPSTGDYSVGIWQINYYDGLYSGRVAAFGTPAQLVAGGLGVQARAAVAIAAGPGGYTNWSTYNSGAYQKFLHGFAITPSGGGPGATEQFGAPPPAPAKDWSVYVGRTAGVFRSAAGNAAHWAAGLRRI